MYFRAAQMKGVGIILQVRILSIGTIWVNPVLSKKTNSMEQVPRARGLQFKTRTVVFIRVLDNVGDIRR